VQKLFKPAAFLLYLLSMLVFLPSGMAFAAVSGVAEGQGLAGGAIVLWYGILFALAALIGALFLAWYGSPNLIRRVNMVLASLLAAIAAVLAYRIMTS
jgi:hypothetical protein